MDISTSHDILNTKVNGTKPNAKHAALIATLRPIPGLENLKYAARRDGYYRPKGDNEVIAADGSMLGPFDKWLKSVLSEANGDYVAVWEKYKDSSLRLAQWTLEKLFFVSTHGPHPSQATQVRVWYEYLQVTQELFAKQNYDRPRSVDDLSGTLVDNASQLPPITIGEPRYRFLDAHNLAYYIREEDRAEAERLDRLERTAVTLNPGTPHATTMPLLELHPELADLAPKGRRLFQDWMRSSAGKNEPFWNHWILAEVSYSKDPRTSQYFVSLIPGWTREKRPPEIKPKKGESEVALWERLQQFDRRVKCPFGWYFYMLHGNVVHFWVGRRVLEGVEEGKITMPACDLMVLREWGNSEYGF